ncbi:MAG: DUF4406 domain-containing protein [Candidatus Woesebacteria bacterium]|nr:DUF4406 domain-containing protein [Candidatus Woesebacteria bacterium]
MKVAYIAGPYRAETKEGIGENIKRAADVALKYWKQGYAVICPHKNTAFFEGCEDSVWLEGDREIISRLVPEKGDIVIAMEGWRDSLGAVVEVALAKNLGLEVVFDKK